jgi:hypothetical protein
MLSENTKMLRPKARGLNRQSRAPSVRFDDAFAAIAPQVAGFTSVLILSSSTSAPSSPLWRHTMLFRRSMPIVRLSKPAA